MIKTAKVLDITYLPDNVKTFAYDYLKDSITGNASYINHYVQPAYFDREDQEPNENHTMLDEYLLSNGCVANENIIILCWW